MPIESSAGTRRVVVRPFAALVKSGRHLTPVDLRFRDARFSAGGLLPPDSPVPIGRISPGHSPAGEPGGFAALAFLLQRTWSEAIFETRWSWGESNPPPEIGITADQRLCGQVSGGFRVTASDRR